MCLHNNVSKDKLKQTFIYDLHLGAEKHMQDLYLQGGGGNGISLLTILYLYWYRECRTTIGALALAKLNL